MIVITGASSGLGLALAETYHNAGEQVVNIARSDCEYADINLPTDLANEGDIARTVKLVNELPGRMSTLVHCAGVMSVEPLEEMTPEALKHTFEVNVFAPMLLTSGLFSRIVADRTDIVNVTSTLALKPAPAELSAYGSSKWALRGFSQYLQGAFARTNRVLTVNAGRFESHIANKATGNVDAPPQTGMSPRALAGAIKALVDLPPNMEVTEVTIVYKPTD